MLLKRPLLSIIVLCCTILIIIGIRTYLVKKNGKPLYTTAHAKKRTIENTIHATGMLEAHTTYKIGSLRQGTLQRMYFQEGQAVKKGDILATIDDGIDDTEVREAQGALETAQQNACYLRNFYERQKKLYQADQIAKDSFEKTTRDYQNSLSAIITQQAVYDSALLRYNNKQIRSPEDGVILIKNSTEGEFVALTSPATVIYTIAKNLDTIKVILTIDESAIGQLKPGQTAELIFDTYPHQQFSCIVDHISNKTHGNNGSVSFETILYLDNKQQFLRPGMSVNATITVEKKYDALSIPLHIFSLTKEAIEKVAATIGYELIPLSHDEHVRLEQKGLRFRAVWVVNNKQFIQKALELGVTDFSYVEIVDGLTEDETIIIDVHEDDPMQSFYKKAFGARL